MRLKIQLHHLSGPSETKHGGYWQYGPILREDFVHFMFDNILKLSFGCFTTYSLISNQNHVSKTT